jgi:hypothetical protein
MAPPCKRARTEAFAPIQRQTRLRIRQQQQIFPFLQLPAEIRLLIYPMCGLNFDAIPEIRPHPQKTTPTILLINRQIHREAKQVLLYNSSVIFTLPNWYIGFRSVISKTLMTQIKNLTIQVGPHENPRALPWDRTSYGDATDELKGQMVRLQKVWEEGGHCLTSLEIRYDSDPCSEHLASCGRGCYVRHCVSNLFKYLKELRGFPSVQFSGSVLKHFPTQCVDTRAAMMRPLPLTLNKLPEDVLSHIFQTLVARSNPVDMWKKFEGPVWESLAQEFALQASNDAAQRVELKVPRPTTRGSRERMNSATTSVGENNGPYRSNTEQMTVIAHFKIAFRSLDQQRFWTPAPFRVSRWMRELSVQLSGHQTLMVDQPFFPLDELLDDMEVANGHGTEPRRTVSPFMTNDYLQTVRFAVIEYHPSFQRNWLWALFLPSLATLWKAQHNLHKLTLRIVDPGNYLDENERKIAVKVFTPLASIRGVNIVEFDGPFKPVDQWKLEKMSNKGR